MNLKIDECGNCLYESNITWNACLDCEGVKNGGKINNDCGFCLDPTAGNFDNYGKNCMGVCDAESPERYILDRCGVCKTTEDSTRDSCVGCDGVAHSNKTLNDCNICVDQNDANFDSYGKDCRGECVVSVSDTHYVDECGMFFSFCNKINILIFMIIIRKVLVTIK